MRAWRIAIVAIGAAAIAATAPARAQDTPDTRPFGTITDTPGTETGDTPAEATPATGVAVDATADATAGAPADPFTTGAVVPEPRASQRVAAEPAVDTSDPATGFITGAALRRTIADDPWAPLGVRAGSFIVYPSVDLATGYTSNSSKTHGGKGAAFGIIAPEFLARSDWSRHEATIALRGSYEAFSNGTSEPAAEAEATTRLDLADLWTANFASHYRYGRESASDPNSPANVDRQSDVHNYGGSAALNGALGRNVFTLEGSADRFLYGDARSGNKRIVQSDRDNTLYGGRLRLGYPLSGSLTPFVEGELTRRQYDERVDDNGIKRSSTGEGVRVGVAVDRAPVTSGEIAVGYAWENYDDAALQSLGAFTVDGSLAWSPVELVTLTTNLGSEIVPSTNANSSGSIVYDGSIDLAYAYRRNATANLTGRIRNEQFEGIGRFDWTYGLGIGTTWRVGRMVELALAYTHDWLDGNRKSRNWTADTIRFDFRMQF